MEYIYVAECDVSYATDITQHIYEPLGVFDSEEKAIHACNDFIPENDDDFDHIAWHMTEWTVSRYEINTGNPSGTVVWGKVKRKSMKED